VLVIDKLIDYPKTPQLSLVVAVFIEIYLTELTATTAFSFQWEYVFNSTTTTTLKETKEKQKEKHISNCKDLIQLPVQTNKVQTYQAIVAISHLAPPH
jgi:hypothetical protein